MEVKQIATIINETTKEALGESAIINEDLSNIVEVGDTIETKMGFDNYVEKLNDVIGRMIFVNRVYKGRLPSVYRDAWEYGSIVEKVSMALPDATENESWELNDGEVYEVNQFYKPTIYVKLWNKRVTFEIPISITRKQVRSSFNTPTQLNSFISMIYTGIENAMTLKLDSLVMRAVNNAIGETVYADYAGTDITKKSGFKAVNLLYKYNNEVNNTGTALTADQAMTNKDFIKYAVKVINDYVDRMQSFSTLFNIEGRERFTPSDKMHIAFLSEFKNSANVYLQSDTFNDEYTKLPGAETVPYWQGTGEDYDFSSTGKIDIKTASNNNVSVTGVIGCIWDHDALGVANLEMYTTANYNAKAEFYNEWHKMIAGIFNDKSENMVVFFIA